MDDVTAYEKEYRITLEDLASNIFIMFLRENKLNPLRFVSYRAIDEYSKLVLKGLKDKRIYGRLDVGRNQTSWFLYFNSDFFKETEYGGLVGLVLNEDKDENALLHRYTGYMALDVYLVFNSIKTDDLDITPVSISGII